MLTLSPYYQQLWLIALRWAFVTGFFFLIGAAVWTIITVNRMKIEQSTALQLLQALAIRAGLKQTIDTMQKEVLGVVKAAEVERENGGTNG